jgi:hypothetical protein
MEAMKQVGIGCFQIFDVGQGIKEGPVKYHSPEWVVMKEFAAKEAERTRIGYELHNCPGWSSSGGPWNTRKCHCNTGMDRDTRCRRQENKKIYS